MAKVLVSIDDDLLQRLDERARELGLSRSALVARLASAELRRGRRDPARRRSIDRARAACATGADPSGIDTTEFIRRMRDER